MIKLIATDMDGTLLKDDHTLSDLTMRYFKRLHQKHSDIYLVICTGRPKSGILPYLKDLGMLEKNCYVISQNGANIFESKTNKELFNAFLSSDELTSWLKLATSHQIGVMAVGKDAYFTIDKQPNDYILYDVALVQAKLVFKTIQQLQQESLYKLLFLESPEVLDQFEALIPLQWRETFYVVRSQPYLIEVLPKGINKAFGLEQLLNQLNVEFSQVLAIGDAMNDYEMLKVVGTGVAMGNADERLKEEADLITLTNEEDGVVYAISHYLQSNE